MSSSQSLYQRCMLVMEKLSNIPGFSVYFDIYSSTEKKMEANDPVSVLQAEFRLGTILCHLINVYNENTIKNIYTVAQVTANPKDAQRNIYHFLLHIKVFLNLSADDMISVSELFQADGSIDGFVKVIRMVELLLDKMEEDGFFNFNRVSSKSRTRMSMDAKTNAEKVLSELLETERKYVADLEMFLNYSRKVQQDNLVPVHVVRQIFSNLSSIVQFQRKFLVGVEDCVVKSGLLSAETTRNSSSNNCVTACIKLGSLFVQHSFSVYGPFCANKSTALETFTQFKDKLMSLSDMINPETPEFGSYLIKPIQRICKYPLLLKELIKYTSDKEKEALHSLKSGLKVIEKAISEVNELIRKEENVHVMNDLVKGVSNWKGLNYHDFGNLLLDDVITMVRKEEKEVHVFLFDKLVLCCKEIKPSDRKRSIMLRKSSNDSNGAHTKFDINGVISVEAIEGLAQASKGGNYDLKIFFKDHHNGEMENVIFRYINEEKQNMWHKSLDELLDLSKRRSEPARKLESSTRSPRTLRKQDRSISIATNKNEYKKGYSISPISEISPQSSNFETRSNGRFPVPPSYENLYSAPLERSKVVPPSITTKKAHFSPMSSPASTDGLGGINSSIDKKDNLKKFYDNMDNLLNELNAEVSKVSIPNEENKENSNIPTPMSRRAVPDRSDSLEELSLANSNESKSLTTRSKNNEFIKVKVHHNQDIYLILMNEKLGYSDLCAKVCEKISVSTEKFRMKYQDDDGDFITIGSDADVQVALKLACFGGKRVFNVYLID